jgi:hypothetical protein
VKVILMGVANSKINTGGEVPGTNHFTGLVVAQTTTITTTLRMICKSSSEILSCRLFVGELVIFETGTTTDRKMMTLTTPSFWGAVLTMELKKDWIDLCQPQRESTPQRLIISKVNSSVWANNFVLI